MMRFIAVFLLFLFSTSFGQKNLDSLLTVWKDPNQSDSIRLLAIDEISKDILNRNPDAALHYALLEYDFAEISGNKQMMSNALSHQGMALYTSGSYDLAFEKFQMGLDITTEIEDKKGKASFIHKMGLIYSIRGDYDKAIDYYITSLKIRTEIGDKYGMSASLNNIGIIYNNQGKFDKAIVYYEKSLELKKEIGNKYGMAASYNNIGLIYAEKDDYIKAVQYFKESIKIKEEIGDRQGIAFTLNNISVIFGNHGEYEKALFYYRRSLKLLVELGDKRGIAILYNNIGSIHKELGEYSKAIVYSKKALEIAQEIGVSFEIRDASYNLYEFYKETGNPSLALKMYELHVQTRDSIQSRANKEEVIRQEYKYEYDKKASADSVIAAEEKKVTDARILAQSAKIESERTQLYTLYGGITLLLLFIGLMYNRNRITHQQKIIIQSQKIKVEIQKELIEEKHTRIKDSISYAQRLQNALLPPARKVKEHLNDSFVLYKPKDVVAGDFYWVEKKDGKVYFAAADCTGHGVPGAMVSVICNHGLNRSVREYGLSDPGQILDKTSEIVIQEFENSDYEVTDGMDVALCVLEGKKLWYAGAHNPLWIIRDGEIIETIANEQPIGKFNRSVPFKTHSIDLKSGDTLYIFSDGYIAQFGGPKGKKFLAKQLKSLLVSIQDKTMMEQKIALDEAFENWQGNNDQIDDICMIGVRV